MKTWTHQRTSAFCLLLALAVGIGPVSAGSGGFALEREWVWTSLGHTIGTGGLEILDVDGDGVSEILATGDPSSYGYDPTGRWYQVELDEGLHQTWSSLDHADSLRLMRSSSSSGAVQVVVLAGETILVYSGATKELIRTFDLPSGEIADFQVADVDGSPGLELVACDFDALYVLDFASGATIATRYGFGGTDLDVGQVDGDAALEVAVAGGGLGGFVLDGATLQLDWADLAGFGRKVRLIDVDDDGTAEIVSGVDDDDDVLRASEPGTGATLWDRQTTGDYALAEGDMDLDGDLEIVLTIRYYQNVYILDGASGAEVFSFFAPEGDIQAVAVGDLAGTAHPEIVWSSGYYDPARLFAASHPDYSLLAEADSIVGPFAGFSTGDVEPDGSLELVTAGRVYQGDGSGDQGRSLVFDVSARRVEHIGAPISGAWYSSVAVGSLAANLDGDAALEVCSVSTYGGNSTLGCEDGATHELEWQVDFPSGTSAASLRFAELDADPEPELLVGGSPTVVYAFEGDTGWLLWRTPPLEEWSYYVLNVLRTADLDGDSAVEVVAAEVGDNYSLFLAIDSATGSVVYGPHVSFIRSLETVQVDTDPALEVVIGDDAGDVRELNPATGALGPPLLSVNAAVDGLRFADFTRDGIRDVVIVADGALRLLDGTTDLEIWRSPFLGYDAGRWDRLAVIDSDHDSLPEIAVDLGYGFALFEAPEFDLFADGFESGDTSAWSSTLP